MKEKFPPSFFSFSFVLKVQLHSDTYSDEQVAANKQTNITNQPEYLKWLLHATCHEKHIHNNISREESSVGKLW